MLFLQPVSPRTALLVWWLLSCCGIQSYHQIFVLGYSLPSDRGLSTRVAKAYGSISATGNRDKGANGGEIAVGKQSIDGSDGLEPTCEELKAMWRFSKRQSRAAEITNEIPTYRDPFSYNVWEPYGNDARSRSIAGLRIGNRHRTRPVYGRVIHKAPLMRPQDVLDRTRAFEEVARMYGTPANVGIVNGLGPMDGGGMSRPSSVDSARRRITAFRLSGGAHLGAAAFPPQSGSFQHLKELIRTERARELQQQRRDEEAAASAASAKQMAAEQRQNMRYSYEPTDRGEPETFNVAHPGILAFPDLLGPSASIGSMRIPMGDEMGNQRELAYLQHHHHHHHPQNQAQYIPYADGPNGPLYNHQSALFDTSSHNNDFDGMFF